MLRCVAGEKLQQIATSFAPKCRYFSLSYLSVRRNATGNRFLETELAMDRRFVRHGLLTAAIFVRTCGVAAAQTVSGVVTDTSGGVLPGVTVAAQNASTKQVRE